ncbi:MAG: hypothetical protein P1U56_16350 [Saprospiraceae bacterium]|nr:hypothetical protein [Saprospiraceae bacterium]
MKTFMYLLLPALLFIITSCSENTISEEENTAYKFQKELSIHDGNGNVADLVIFANTKEALADQTKDVLYLTTSTASVEPSTTENSEFYTEEEIDYIEENEVFVYVENYSFHSNVTSFSVRSKIESFQIGQSSTRASDTNYHYAYGSSGVTGAKVKYLTQTCNAEYITTKLSKKNNSWSVFWNKLASGTLYNPGNKWSYNGSTTYYKYKLRVRGKQGCTGTATYSYNWLT